MVKDYIKWIRSKVGHEKVILVFTGGCVFDERGRVLLQKRGDSGNWGGFQVEQLNWVRHQKMLPYVN